MATITGGDKFKEQIAEIARKAQSRKVRVGFLAKSTYVYPNGMTTPQVAAIHEFGAPSVGIPPRPFFRYAITLNKRSWPEQAAELIVKYKYDTDRTLERMGAIIQGQIIEAINEFQGTPLKPATIKRKGFDKQLVESGHMKNSVDYELI